MTNEQTEILRRFIQHSFNYIGAEIEGERRFHDRRCGSAFHDLGQLNGKLDQYIRHPSDVVYWNHIIEEYRINTEIKEKYIQDHKKEWVRNL